MRVKWLLVSGFFSVGLLLLVFSYASETYLSKNASLKATSEGSGVSLLAAVETAAPPWVESLWGSMLQQVNGVLSFAAQAIDAVGDVPGQLLDITSNDPPESPADLQNFEQDINASLGLPFVPTPEAYAGTLIFNVPLQVSNELTVSGVTRLTDLAVSGEFSINDLSVPGTGTFGAIVGGGTQLGSLTVSGNTQLNTLSVTGPVSFANLTAGNLAVTNALTAEGNISAQGGITTGGADIDLEGGNIFAANVVNEIIAGDDIVITGTPNAPIISADVKIPSLGSRVRSLNDLNGSLTLAGGSGITVTESGDTITIANASGLGTYLGLTDTPSSYLTNALPYVNATGSALTQSSNLTFNGTQLAIGSTTPVTALTVAGALSLMGQQEARWYDSSNTGYVGFRASSTVSTTTIWTLPAGDGNANDLLITDGAGNLRFVNPNVFGAVSVLDDLTDVTVTTPGSGEFLQYDGAQWVNVASTSLGLGNGTYLGLSDTPVTYVAGAIQFANATSSGLTQSSNFVFTGSQLAIGTSSPLSTLTVAGGDVSVLDQQAVRFYNPTNTNYVGFRASSTLSGDAIWTLPTGDGSTNDFLITDGSGNLSFANASALGIVSALNDLADVSLSATTTGDVLVFDGSEWINQATSSLGLGDGTFLGLLDTPNVYMSNGVVFANTAANALTQSTNFTFNGTQVAIGSTTPLTTLTINGDVSLTNRQTLRFYDLDSSNYVGLRASSSITSNLVWTLPDSDGFNNQVLITDGSGNLSFEDVSAIGGGASTFLDLNDTPVSYVAGAIPYASTTLNQLLFSPNFMFDGTRLGIGTGGAPSAELTVHGSVYAGPDASTPGFIYNDAADAVSIGTTNSDEKLNVIGGTVLQRGGLSGETYQPRARGSLSLPANANDVFLVGTLAYVVSASAGTDFHIIDVSDKDDPLVLGSTNLPSAGNSVDVKGDYAYVVSDVTGDDFHVVDITNSSAPSVVASINLPTSANAVMVRGRYAYVTSAAVGNDFHVIDIVDPLNPVEVGSVNLGGNGNEVALKRDYAFVVTDTANQFLTVDISNVTSPTVVASSTLPSDGEAIVVRGNYAYIGTNPAGNDFHIYDISNPLSPTIVGALSLTAGVYDIYVAGYYAYLSTSGTNEDLRVIDISDPSNPTEVGGATVVAGSSLSLVVQGRYAYLGSPASGDAFHIFDISGVEAQSLMAQTIEGGALAILGNLVAADASLSDGLRVGANGIQTDGSLLIQGSGTSIFSGNVAIGTSSAPHALTINGDASISGALYDSANIAGTNGQVLVASGTGQIWTATSSLGLSSAFTTSAQLSALLTDETGAGGNLVFSTSPTFSGTVEVSAFSASSTITLAGTSANIALGSNYLSGDGDDEGIFITSTGWVGIGTSTPSSTLTVDGTISASNLFGGVTTLSTDAQGNIIRTPSDITLKTNVQPIENALEKVLALRGVQYQWIDTARFGSQTEIGFIAQEVDLVLPETVRKGGDYWSLNTANVVAAVVEAIKEMWVAITGNQEKIEVLENRVQFLEELLDVEPQPASVNHSTSDEDTDDEENDVEDEVDGEEESETTTGDATTTSPIATSTTASTTPDTEPEMDTDDTTLATSTPSSEEENGESETDSDVETEEDTSNPDVDEVAESEDTELSDEQSNDT